ncbi:M16 family metallopeptidase [Arcticibacter sp. MXS-1]|uniref:M16 family metallopeptidase n=1 Tax=Arcticibacter sp. MXS-1 TaxID=3341726 RepID=UPI0035A8BD4B
MDHQVFTLPNGIRLLYHRTESTITHSCIVINTGSRDEPDGKDGLAHFIEHLLFKQTEKRSTKQILNYIESVGGDLNAYTTKEYTCIHASFLSPYLSRAFDLFEDIVFHSTFPEKEMDKEKSVILDEIASYEDQPEEAIQDDFEDMMFEGHSLGRNILGTSESVMALRKEDVTSFLTAGYCPGQIVIGVSGSYPIHVLEHHFQKYFGHILPRPNAVRRTPPALYTSNRRVKKPIAQCHCVLGTQAYSLHDERKTGLMLLNNILGGSGMSSVLNLTVREKYGIAYTIESNYTPLCDTGIFSIYFGTDAGKAERALALIQKQLRRFREDGLNSRTLEMAKKKFNGLIALGEDNRLSLIIAMTKSLIDYDRVDTLAEVFSRVNAVTPEQISAIAEEVFDPERLSVLMFEPEGDQD